MREKFIYFLRFCELQAIAHGFCKWRKNPPKTGPVLGKHWEYLSNSWFVVLQWQLRWLPRVTIGRRRANADPLHLLYRQQHGCLGPAGPLAYRSSHIIWHICCLKCPYCTICTLFFVQYRGETKLFVFGFPQKSFSRKKICLQKYTKITKTDAKLIMKKAKPVSKMCKMKPFLWKYSDDMRFCQT